MRIAVEGGVLEDVKWFPILDVVLLLVEDRRHVLAPECLDTILDSRWLNERPADVRELIRLSSTNSSYDKFANRSSVTIDSSSPRAGRVEYERFNTRVHPLDALQFLSMPFQVIVENEWFDGGFILWMAKALGFTQLVAAYRQGRFVFRHAGGKDSIHRSAAVFSNGVWARHDGAYARAFRLWLCVILDNDARHPGDYPNAAIVSVTTPLVAFIHRLSKRSIESYIPIGLLRKFDGSPAFRRKIEAFGRMTSLQRAPLVSQWLPPR